jgi:uncharacterized protein (TIGR03067 family)
MRGFGLVLGLMILGLTASMARSDDQPADKLAGTYAVTSESSFGGRATQKGATPDQIVITKNTFTATDKDRAVVFDARYTIDTTRKPWVIQFTETKPKEGQKCEGILEMSGPTVKICYALPGGTTPTTFKAANDKQVCVEMKRTEPRGPGGKDK